MGCKHYFREQLRSRGFRLTPQREIVLDVLHETEGHVTADDVYDRVRAISSAVDISTVYRTLELLRDLDLVAEIDLDSGQRRYELVGVEGPHHHIHCRSCGKLIPLDAEIVQPLVDSLAKSHGFRAEPSHLVIDGLCEECAEAGRSELPSEI